MSFLEQVELSITVSRKEVGLWPTSILDGSWLKHHLLKERHDMNFYTKQHEFYCGIDLHANSMHVCVVDFNGQKQLARNFLAKALECFY